MRQYGFIPAPNAAANTPAVSATENLGTGGGAGVQTPDSGNYGDVFVIAGVGWASEGSLVLTFPGTPPTLFIAGEEAFGTVTQETDTNDVTISWADAVFVAGNTYRLHYEWADPLKAN